MFSSIFNFWRGSPASRGAHLARPMPAAPRAPVASVPARFRPYDSSIDHHPALIAELRAEHAMLLEAYGQVGEAMRHERWKSVAEGLVRLRSMLTDHLLKEGAKLYCYLQRNLDYDEDTYSLFRNFKTEMGGIGKAAFAFVARYANLINLQTPTQQAAFKAEYEAIGAVLVDRIKREEAQLYPLYQPASALA